MFRWQGNGAGTKNAWNDGRNWVDENDAPYAQARYPGSLAGVQDEVLIDISLATGASALAGYDGSTLETLKSFKVSSEYESTIGSADIYLQIKALEIMINSPKIAGIYLQQLYAGDDGNVVVTGGSNINLKGTIHGFRSLRGSGTIKTGASLYQALIGYTDSQDVDSCWTVESGVTIDQISQTGGAVDCYAALSAGINPNLFHLTQYGGTWSQYADLTRYYGMLGTFKWIKGNITRAVINGAVFDGSVGNSARSIDILEAAGNAVISLNNGLNNIRVCDYVKTDGGQLEYSAGATTCMKAKSYRYVDMEDEVTIAPAASGNTTWLRMTEYEHITLVLLGASSSWEGMDVVVSMQAASDNTGTGAEDITSAMKLVEGETDETLVNVKQYGIWGFSLPVDKPYVALYITNNLGTPITFDVLGIKRSY